MTVYIPSNRKIVRQNVEKADSFSSSKDQYQIKRWSDEILKTVAKLLRKDKKQKNFSLPAIFST